MVVGHEQLALSCRCRSEASDHAAGRAAAPMSGASLIPGRLWWRGVSEIVVGRFDEVSDPATKARQPIRSARDTMIPSGSRT